MVTFSRRTARGAIAATLVVLVTTLGGCAAAPSETAGLIGRIETAGDCPAGRTRSCVVHGPRREDASCGCDDPRPLEAALGRLAGY